MDGLPETGGGGNPLEPSVEPIVDQAPGNNVFPIVRYGIKKYPRRSVTSGIQILLDGKGKGVQARRALPGTWASCIPLTPDTPITAGGQTRETRRDTVAADTRFCSHGSGRCPVAALGHDFGAANGGISGWDMPKGNAEPHGVRSLRNVQA